MNISQKNEFVKILLRNIYILKGLSDEMPAELGLQVKTQLDFIKIKSGADLVRVGVLGQTGSGKSTAINALTGKILLPECPDVSTPVPCEIRYHDHREPTITILKKHSMSERCSSVGEFASRFCYNTKDQRNRETSRFSDVSQVLIFTESDFLMSGGIALIDTPGINASKNDTANTLRFLENGLDIVIFETFHSTILEDEINFIRNNILGIGKTTVKVPTPLENLILLHNSRSSLAPLPESYRFGLRRIFIDPKDINGIKPYSPERISAFLNTNVIFLNILKARIAIAGLYPYVKYAPMGHTAEYIDEIQSIAAYEETLAENVFSVPQNFVELQDLILSKADHAAKNKNSSALMLLAVDIARIADLCAEIFASESTHTIPKSTADQYIRICENMSAFIAVITEHL